ncbi:transposase [Mycolicibacterium farcinogenes]|uniref:transposase n=1 Tax=Mycolicibacterium farcinogenes TaxID=1802 RepID=UPI001C8E882C|nr:transposase [Mycolicibacterium farcinogenes]QZH61399.1 transposase [Mycolicibacterium farcinogenes]
MSPVTQASKDALAAHTLKRRDAVSARIEKALKAMRREKATITISSVARRAKVTRPSIHRRPELLAKIKAHQPLAVVDTAPDPPAATDGDSSILAALRLKLTAKESQVAELKAALRERDRTIATLHGEIDRLTAAR